MSTLTFKPWPHSPPEDLNIKAALERVRDERGAFRGITEASLQEEIAAEGALELSESEDEDGEENEETAARPATREDFQVAKTELMYHILQAEHDIFRTLDYVSLAVSKDAPGTLVEKSITPEIKRKFPLGTLGTDLWKRMPVDKAKRAQEELLATNVRMEGLQQSADGLLAAATKLEQNARRETSYWDSILSISEKGWNVCRVPKQPHRLAVTFGFTESSPQFSGRGIAGLQADPNGDVRLESGIGSRPEALRVVLKRGGQVIGSSKLPVLPDQDETTLEARIRHARDSLFDEELFHEMILESRALMSLGIGMEGNKLRFRGAQEDASAPELSLELVRLDQEDIAPSYADAESDGLAQTIALIARLMLMQAHRERLHKRSEIPPILTGKKEVQSRLPLLRPIMSLMLHHSAITQLDASMTSLEAVLTAANISVSAHRPHFNHPATDVKIAEDLCNLLLQPWTSTASLSITDPKSNTFTLAFAITTNTLTNYTLGPAYTFKSSLDDRRFDSNSIDGLRLGVDSAVASGLSKQLGDVTPGPWRSIIREALIEKCVDDGGMDRMWVVLDSSEAALTLGSVAKEVVWRPGKEGRTGFWEAWRDVLEV